MPLASTYFYALCFYGSVLKCRWEIYIEIPLYLNILAEKKLYYAVYIIYYILHSIHMPIRR